MMPPQDEKREQEIRTLLGTPKVNIIKDFLGFLLHNAFGNSTNKLKKPIKKVEDTWVVRVYELYRYVNDEIDPFILHHFVQFFPTFDTIENDSLVNSVSAILILEALNTQLDQDYIANFIIHAQFEKDIFHICFMIDNPTYQHQGMVVQDRYKEEHIDIQSVYHYCKKELEPILLSIFKTPQKYLIIDRYEPFKMSCDLVHSFPLVEETWHNETFQYLKMDFIKQFYPKLRLDDVDVTITHHKKIKNAFSVNENVTYCKTLNEELSNVLNILCGGLHLTSNYHISSWFQPDGFWIKFTIEETEWKQNGLKYPSINIFK